jgi:hypothetical protein
MAGVRLVPEGAPIQAPGLDLALHDLDAPVLWLNQQDFLSKTHLQGARLKSD